MLVLEAFFLQAIYWSLGAGLIEEERERFDGYVKFLAALALVQNPTATPGPGRWAERCWSSLSFLFFLFLFLQTHQFLMQTRQ